MLNPLCSSLSSIPLCSYHLTLTAYPFPTQNKLTRQTTTRPSPLATTRLLPQPTPTPTPPTISPIRQS
ncbi:hypothetical protein EON65_18020 [archaeon]|nr:MAG: hypothetical protein EON65_18020 [archaeon]